MKDMETGKHPQLSRMAFCCVIILSMICYPLVAMDKIGSAGNSIIEAKVIESIQEQIKYKKISNANGSLCSIYKDNIEMIIFKNGEKEVLKKDIKQENTSVDVVEKDSLQCIEDMWGLKFENTTINGGGIMIVKLESNSVFKQQTPLKRLYIFNVNNGNSVRVKNTSELARVLFESYSQGISKIKMGSGGKGKLSRYTYDHWAFDLSGISKCHGLGVDKKLGIAESRLAGGKVERIYNPEKIGFAMPGFCSGLLFGVAGIALVGGVAVLAPGVKYLPVAPPNVDASAWAAGYKAKVKKKRLIGGLIGSILGSVLVIGAFSSVN